MPQKYTSLLLVQFLINNDPVISANVVHEFIASDLQDFCNTYRLGDVTQQMRDDYIAFFTLINNAV
jgi:hypothetical protein